MKYERGICGDCEQSVMTRDGRAIEHNLRGTNIRCDGSGDFALDDDTPAMMVADVIEPAPVEPKLKPAHVARKPIVQPEPEPAPAWSKEDIDTLVAAQGRIEAKALATPTTRMKIKEARERLKRATVGGTIDLEALALCGCPSLARAIKEYLSRQ